ncbi:CoA-acylating methylmalonate-semialdehyde dehydrogenase [Alteromonas oceanisediminis]|uniref:CoA-acylating methylmalonate-semialdehyde dehydrogenase n=1 Tax=Alteromonas oceanisediminis TaxID=2836180 RepID=UPI001BDA3E39|nr:CoA-acylating methylmalonate-semialdehyde dehydrogenase [Alteromonas oceanisediminis]MBT0585177.1 CoA-acylating methylmalonate-semialdehyde dehydrogenase [Alteromonas oceanisediminis]
MDTIPHFVNGDELMASDVDRNSNFNHSDVFNPSIGASTARVVHASATQVDLCVSMAEQAFEKWKKVSLGKRAAIMFTFKSLVEENIDYLCQLIGQEHGKIAHDALGEVKRGIENIEFACSAPLALKGEHNRQVGSGIDVFTEPHPLGVVAGITPFNFPAMVPLWMFPLAIVCGNCFILKPSEKVPSAAIFLAKLLKQAGLPDGVFNVIHGGRETVDAILHHPAIKAVSFVGSTPVAKSIYKTATANGKRCQALGGAKNHAVIMPDANVNFVSDQIIGAAFGSSGERCMAISVAVCVGKKTADDFVKACKAKIAHLKVGPSSENSNDFGPLITKQHLQAVQAHVEEAERQGASLVVDGRYPKIAGEAKGFFMGATLIDHVNKEMKCYQEEIFGPVLCVLRVDNLKQAVDLINANQYGNGVAIFTTNGFAAQRFKEHIEVGMVGVNVPIPVPVAYHSFGGWKNSLFGDLHAYGPDGVKFYTRRKTITQRWSDNAQETGPAFGFPAND